MSIVMVPWNGPEMRDEADACLISVDEGYLAHGNLHQILCTSSNNTLVSSPACRQPQSSLLCTERDIPSQWTGTKTIELSALSPQYGGSE